ncbi:MAG: hypothetical protein AB8G99_08050 [Planctomycetaceae bacterium]
MSRKRDYGRESAALLAAAIVFIMGFLALLFVIATSFRDPLWPTLGTAFGLFAAFCLMVAFLRAKESGHSGGMAAWFKGTKPEKLPDYSPRRVRTSRSNGTNNAPPTADDVREIQESSANTWVPSSVRKPKQ